MRRRDFSKHVFGSVVGAGIAGSAHGATPSAQTVPSLRKNELMHVGGDYHSVAGGRGAVGQCRAGARHALE